VLLDQLALLEVKLGEVLEAVAKGDTDRLLVHGRFLEDRFADSELDVGLGS
jgi:ABC-type tungstate transport system permease subunit